MNKPRLSLLGLSLLAALGGCVNREPQQMPVQILSAPADQAQLTEVMPIEQVLRPQDVLDVIFHIGTTSQQRYRVQPGDQVDVSFLTAPELGGSKLVLPDGSIDMPYVGNVQVAGLSAEQARQTLETQYAKVLKKPQITFSISHAMAQLDNLRTSLTNPATGLSREIVVGSDGRASFPLLGSLSLQGKSLQGVPVRLARNVGGNIGPLKRLFKSALNRRIAWLAGGAVRWVCTPRDLQQGFRPAGVVEVVAHPTRLADGDFGDDYLPPGQSLEQLLNHALPQHRRIAYSEL